MHFIEESEMNILLTLINLHPNEYSQELHYYLIAVKLDRCVGSCHTLNVLSNKVCLSNETVDLNLIVFNMITVKKESKILKIENVNLMVENVIQIKSGILMRVQKTSYMRKRLY